MDAKSEDYWITIQQIHKNVRLVSSLTFVWVKTDRKGSVEYTITKTTSSSSDTVKTGLKRAIKDIKGISSVSTPEGKSIEEMSIISPSIRWKEPDRRIKELREEAKSSGGVYEKMKRGWKEAAAWWKP